MNRVDFMDQLESLLQNIAPAERDEAIQYYNDYFDDAGRENEQEVIEALGNPARVAENIKRDLLGNGLGENAARKVKASDRVIVEYGKGIPEDSEENAQENPDSSGQSEQSAEKGSDRDVSGGRTAGGSRIAGYGQTTGNSQTSGKGQETGCGQGTGNGQTAGSSQGTGYGQTAGSGQGTGYGQTAGNGQGTGYGQSAGNGQGTGYGQTAGNGQGTGYGQSTGYSQTAGNGSAGYGQTAGNSNAGYSQTAGNSGAGYGQTAGNGQGTGYGQSTKYSQTAGNSSAGYSQSTGSGQGTGYRQDSQWAGDKKDTDYRSTNTQNEWNPFEDYGYGSQGTADNAGTSSWSYNSGSTAYQGYEGEKPSKKEGMPVWATALIVTVLVISFPVWIGAAGALFGLLMGWFGLIFGFGVTAACLLLVLIVLVVVGVLCLFANPWVGMALIGGGLISGSVGILFLMLTVAMAGIITPAIFKGIAFVFRGFRKKQARA